MVCKFVLTYYIVLIIIYIVPPLMKGLRVNITNLDNIVECMVHLYFIIETTIFHYLAY